MKLAAERCSLEGDWLTFTVVDATQKNGRAAPKRQEVSDN